MAFHHNHLAMLGLAGAAQQEPEPLLGFPVDKLKPLTVCLGIY